MGFETPRFEEIQPEQVHGQGAPEYDGFAGSASETSVSPDTTSALEHRPQPQLGYGGHSPESAPLVGENDGGAPVDDPITAFATADKHATDAYNRIRSLKLADAAPEDIAAARDTFVQAVGGVEAAAHELVAYGDAHRDTDSDLLQFSYGLARGYLGLDKE